VWERGTAKTVQPNTDDENVVERLNTVDLGQQLQTDTDTK
jgi:hypothetical protein